MEASWLNAATTTMISAAELRAQGIWYEQLPLQDAAYQRALDELRAERFYTAQDEVSLSPSTENLAGICAKFLDEHHHEEDEVRFVLEGEGIFDIRSTDDRWMRVKVTEGDLIVVPAGRHHRFLLTDMQTIRCIRLFQNASGWTPVYRTSAAAAAG